MTKKSRLYYLTMIWYCATLMFPVFSYEPFLDYERLRSFYAKMTPVMFNTVYGQTRKYGVSLDDFCALINMESNWNPTAISVAGARGLCQIMPFHHKGNASDLYNIELNVEYGVKYYRWCLTYAKGDKKKALVYYNAGPMCKNYSNWGYVSNITYTSSKTKHLMPELYELR